MGDLLRAAEAERSVLGAVLLSPDVLGWLDLEPEHFASPPHRHVWEATRGLYGDRVAVDVTTLEHVLRQRGVLEAMGGLAYLSDLALAVPTADNVEHYAAILRQSLTTRRIADVAARIAWRIDSGMDGDELLSDTQAALSRVAAKEDGRGVMSPAMVADEWRRVLQDMERRDAGVATWAGVPSGLQALDDLTGGIPRKVLTLVGGLPGTGKSTLGISIAEHAESHGFGCHSLSYEDGAETYAQRLLGRLAGVDIQRVRRRELERDELARLAAAADVYHRRRGWLLEHVHGMRVDHLVRRVRARRRELDTAIVLVDYVGNMPSPEPGLNKVQAIEENLARLEELAATDDLAVVVFSQFSRAYAGRDDKRPRLSDFRDSGALEQKAKLVLALHYPAAHGESEYPSGHPMHGGRVDASHLEILVLKNHQGESNVTIMANYDRPRGRIA